MKYNFKKGFTLVELIVVITILAILSTLGFVAYTDYLKGVRDSSRIQQMTEIHKAVTLYGTRSKLPLPEESITIISGGSSVGTQGYATQSVLDTIKFSDGGVDPKSKKPYTYFVSADRKYAQLLGFFEERNTNELLTINDSYAAESLTEYESLYPQVVGAELGVLVQETTQIPIQDIKTGTYDILTSTGTLISYASNTKITTGSGVDLIGMVPRISCKKILDTIGSGPSQIYKINPIGNSQVEVYCDMNPANDGGGWTFVGFIDNDTNANDVTFKSAVGIYDIDRGDTSSLYLLNMANLRHTELLWLTDGSDIQTANSQNKLIQFRYDEGFEGFQKSPVTPGCTNFFGSASGLDYRVHLEDSYSRATNPECGTNGVGVGYWGVRSTSNTRLLQLRNDVDGAGNGKGAFYDSRSWGITNTGDPEYYNNLGKDAWIYVR